MEVAIVMIVILALAGGVGFYYFKVQAPKEAQKQAHLRQLSIERQRAENKVRMSDIILRADIEILQQTNSPMVNDAIALRRAQIEQGRNPEA